MATALLDFARSENATQLVLGASRRSRWQRFVTGPGIGATTLRGSGPIDVHLVTHTYAGKGRGTGSLSGQVTALRRGIGLGLAVIGMPALTAALVAFRSTLTLPSDVLLFLLAVVGVAIVGGLYSALLAAVGGLLLLNYYFAPPLHTFTVGDRDNVLALVVFIAIAVMVSSVVNVAAQRGREAAHSSAEAKTLATLAAGVLRGESAVHALLAQVRETFGLDSVTLLERDGNHWQAVEEVHENAGTEAGRPNHRRTRRNDAVAEHVPIDDDHRLAIHGRTLPAADRRLLAAFATQAAVALRQRRLTEAAQAARPALEADRTRTALLTAVSHDLRTPLAAATAAVAGLRSAGVTWTPSERDEMLGTAESALARLGRLVANLLDMSRLQAGALSVFPRPVAVSDVVAHAAIEVEDGGHSVTIDIADDLPDVVADAGLLERVIVNLVGNAHRHAHAGRPPVIAASAIADRVEIRVTDRGRGVPSAHQDEIFAPFQQRGDTDTRTGVGLGLAVSRGLTEAMAGTLTAEDTPGGGLTMVVALLPDAPVPPGVREIGAERPAPDVDRALEPAPWEQS